MPAWFGPLLALSSRTPAQIGLESLARPAIRVGWILVVGPLLQVMPLLIFLYAAYGVVVEEGALPGLPWCVMLAQATWPLLFAWPVAVALAFPAWRTLSPRWRRFTIASVANALFFMSLGLLATPFEEPFAEVANPLVGRGPVPGEQVLAVVWVVPWIGMLRRSPGPALRSCCACGGRLASSGSSRCGSPGRSRCCHSR